MTTTTTQQVLHDHVAALNQIARYGLADAALHGTEVDEGSYHTDGTLVTWAHHESCTDTECLCAGDPISVTTILPGH